MAQDSFKIKKSLNIVPQAGTSNLDEKGDLGYDSSADKAALYTDSAPDYLVTENKAQSLENKTIEDPVVNDGVFNDPQIQNMSATGGSLASATLNTPTINDMSATGGSLANAQISDSSILNASASGGTYQDINLYDANASGGAFDAASITNSTIDASTITNSSITGSSFQGAVELDDQSSAFFLELKSDSNLTQDRTLTFDIQDQNVDITLPASGTLATLAGSETLTNKTVSGASIQLSDIDGGIASNTSRLTLPKGNKVDLDALTRKEATLVYAQDQDTVYIDNGSTLSPLGGNFIAYANENINTSSTISINLVVGLQFRRVTGNGGTVITAAAPFGSSAPADGTVIVLAGQSDTNMVTLTHSDVAKGCLLNGDCTLGRGNTLTLQYDATLDRYIELNRNAY